MKRNWENKTSESQILRNKWLKKGIELINITSLCDLRLGCSGSCNNFNEPDETIHHGQLQYRKETIANLTANGVELIAEDKHLLYNNEEGDFIIFRKVKNA